MKSEHPQRNRRQRALALAWMSAFVIATTVSGCTRSFKRSDRAASFTEYGLLLALIAAVVVGAATALGSTTSTTLTQTAQTIGATP